MEISGMYVPEEILHIILSYVPFTYPLPVCKLFVSLSKPILVSRRREIVSDRAFTYIDDNGTSDYYENLFLHSKKWMLSNGDRPSLITAMREWKKNMPYKPIGLVVITGRPTIYSFVDILTKFVTHNMDGPLSIDEIKRMVKPNEGALLPKGTRLLVINKNILREIILSKRYR